MTRIAKLYATALARRDLRFSEFERLLEAFGFIMDRQRGSHRIYRHPDVPGLLNVQPVGKAAKDYQVGQFLDMVEEYGLGRDIGDDA